MSQSLPDNCGIFRFFAADSDAVAAVLDERKQSGEVQQYNKMSRGSEMLIMLQAADAEKLQAVRAGIGELFGDSLYGENNTTLMDSAVTAMQQNKKSFAAADVSTCNLIAGLLQKSAGAENVFSPAKPQEETLAFAGNVQSTAKSLLTAMGEACKAAGTEYAAAVVSLENGSIAAAGAPDSPLLAYIPATENAGLWLLDMLRRLSAGLAQNPKVHGFDKQGIIQIAQEAGLPVPKENDMMEAARKLYEMGRLYDTKGLTTVVVPNAGSGQNGNSADTRTASADGEDEPQEPAKKGHGLLIAAIAVLVLAAAAVAAAWYITGGNLTALFTA